MRHLVTVLLPLFLLSFAARAELSCSFSEQAVDKDGFVHAVTDGYLTSTDFESLKKRTVRIVQTDGSIVSYGGVGRIFVTFGQEVRAGEVIATKERDGQPLVLSVGDKSVCHVHLK